MSKALRWPVAILLSSLLLVGLVLADAHSAARLVVTLWFLLLCTGMSFVPLLPVTPPAAQLVLGIALSLAIDTVVATTMLAAAGFSMDAGLIALVAICMAGCGLQARRWARVRLATEVRLYSHT